MNPFLLVLQLRGEDLHDVGVEGGAQHGHQQPEVLGVGVEEGPGGLKCTIQ